MRSLGHQTLKGIIESDETFFLESEKGKKNITYRKPRKCGGIAKKRGISKEQICVIVAHDRNGQIISQMKGLPHEPINVSRKVYVRKGIYHIQHVNSYHKRLKDWMDRFQGVATKYLNNYLYWHQFLEMNKKLPSQERIKDLLLSSCQSVNFINIKRLRSE